MILFLSNINKELGLNYKQINIENSVKLKEFIKNNSRNLDKFEFILIDESLLDEQTLKKSIDKFKKIILYSNNEKTKFNYEYYLILNDIPLIKQYENIKLNFNKEKTFIKTDDTDKLKKEIFIKNSDDININNKLQKNHLTNQNNKMIDNIENKKEIVNGDIKETQVQENDNLLKDLLNDFNKVDNSLSLDKEENTLSEDKKIQKNILTNQNNKIIDNIENKKEIVNEDTEEIQIQENNDLKDLLNNFNKVDKSLSLDKEENTLSENKKKSNSLFEKQRIKNQEKINRKKEEKKYDKEFDKKTKESSNKNDNAREDIINTEEINIEYDPQKIEKQKEEIKDALDSYENKAHIKDEELNSILNKHYNPNTSNDDIYKLNKDKTTENKKNVKHKINLPKIPKFNKKNSEKTIQNQSISSPINIVSKGEIAVAGGLKSVGTTYCAFKIAKNLPKSLSIGYFQYNEDEQEISMLREIQEQGYIDDNIYIYNEKDKLQAYQQKDLVVVDYGYLDKSDKILLLDFERANEKYIVVNTKFNKIMSINSAIRYSEESSGFKTIFNMQDARELISLQKEYKYLEILCFEYDSI